MIHVSSSACRMDSNSTWVCTSGQSYHRPYVLLFRFVCLSECFEYIHVHLYMCIWACTHSNPVHPIIQTPHYFILSQGVHIREAPLFIYMYVIKVSHLGKARQRCTNQISRQRLLKNCCLRWDWTHDLQCSRWKLYHLSYQGSSANQIKVKPRQSKVATWSGEI